MLVGCSPSGKSPLQPEGDQPFRHPAASVRGGQTGEGRTGVGQCCLLGSGDTGAGSVAESGQTLDTAGDNRAVLAVPPLDADPVTDAEGAEWDRAPRGFNPRSPRYLHPDRHREQPLAEDTQDPA